MLNCLAFFFHLSGASFEFAQMRCFGILLLLLGLLEFLVLRGCTLLFLLQSRVLFFQLLDFVFHLSSAMGLLLSFGLSLFMLGHGICTLAFLQCLRLQLKIFNACFELFDLTFFGSLLLCFSFFNFIQLGHCALISLLELFILSLHDFYRLL